MLVKRSDSDLETGRIVGGEALSRSGGSSPRSPTMSSLGCAQGLDSSKWETGGTLLSDAGSQTGSQLGRVDVSLSDMVDLSAAIS